jgi:hypothetical protein
VSFAAMPLQSLLPKLQQCFALQYSGSSRTSNGYSVIPIQNGQIQFQRVKEPFQMKSNLFYVSTYFNSFPDKMEAFTGIIVYIFWP